MGIISPPGELCQFGFARKGASAPRSRTEVLIPSLGHLIPLREIGGGMGIISPSGRALLVWLRPQGRFRAAQSN